MEPIFTRGDAQLYCGDYSKTLPAFKADLIFTSPPYNIGSKSERKDGLRKEGRFDPKSFGAVRDYFDDYPEPIYQDMQAKFLVWAADHLAPNGTLVYNHKPRRRNREMILPSDWFRRPEVRARLTLMDEVIWDRGSTHNHEPSMIWPHSERLYVFRQRDGAYRLDNHTTGDVWRINRAKPIGHPTAFPEELALKVIKLWSQPGDLVCDPYMGSGTAGRVAIQVGRTFIGAELDEKYYQLSCDRIAEVDDLGQHLHRRGTEQGQVSLFEE